MQRWPLYLRQVKQILRSVDESFDERRYGFTGIVEALRYCQREGLFRLDRDRQGVLRVYPGPVLQRASTAAPQHAIDTDATPAGAAAAPLEDDDNRGNRIESGDRFDRGGRGDRAGAIAAVVTNAPLAAIGMIEATAAIAMLARAAKIAPNSANRWCPARWSCSR